MALVKRRTAAGLLTDELRSRQAPTMPMFGERDFSPLPDIAEMFELLP